MRIGFIQFAPTLGDPAGTRSHVSRLLAEAPRADLLVLPELANSGYRFESREQARALAETAQTSPFVDLIRAYCDQNRCHVVTGLCERDGEALYNSAFLIGPGGIVGTYRKLHLFLDEKDYFRPGDQGLPVFDIGTCRVGMLICFDWIFPETWRVLALEGADLVCHPSNLVLPTLAQRAAPVHAVSNRVFVITANRIGTEGDLQFTGGSLVATPRAEVLVEAPGDREWTAVVDVDPALARDKSVTPRNDVLADRRPDVYGRLSRP